MNRRSFVALAAAVLTSPFLPRWLGRRERAPIDEISAYDPKLVTTTVHVEADYYDGEWMPRHTHKIVAPAGIWVEVHVLGDRGPLVGWILTGTTVKTCSPAGKIMWTETEAA